MKMELWTMIPAIMILTGFYWVMGNNGVWLYNQNDWLIGNAIVSLGVGLCYIGEGIYEKIKEK